MLSVFLVCMSLNVFISRAYELGLLSDFEDDPGKHNLELDNGINYGADAYKFTAHVKKLSLPFVTLSKILTQIDAHDAFIVTVNVKVNPYNFGSVFSVTGFTGEILLDFWIKSGENPAIGFRYSPINSSRLETLTFGPVPSLRTQGWNKIVLHVYRVGVFQSVVDVYVNCERIGRKITRSILDLFAYKKWFVTRRLDFRVGQKGYGNNVYSRFLGSMQDLRLSFKRSIEKYIDKKHCKFLYDKKINIIHYARGLAEPIGVFNTESAVVTELLSLVKDLRYDLTIQAAELKYIRKIIEGCEMCRVTNFCQMKPCYPGVHCFHAPKSKNGFHCGNCPFGSHGNGINCTDIDECLLSPCSIMSKCINKSPGYACEPCPQGYTGNVPFGIGLAHAARTKQICVDIDECLIENGGCSKLVKCKNTMGSLECQPCPPGYEGDPRVECHFVEFCSDNNPKTNPCSKFATCTPLNGGREARCDCRIGFAGNGFYCGFDKDVDGYPDKGLNCSEESCKGDNCPDMPNSNQLDRDKDSIGDLCDDDMDNDGVPNDKDNCRWVPNTFQRDKDRDGFGDVCDNCLEVKNRDQEDLDEDGIGDLCDIDRDGDGLRDDIDNCPMLKNVAQKDIDGDGRGDACDNCKSTPNEKQKDADSDLLGDKCDNNIDSDRDGVEDSIDNCPVLRNPEQADADSDGVGDLCDEDDDNDSVLDKDDNCPLVANKDQKDTDASGVGDVCKGDWDGDGVPDAYDASKHNSKITFPDFRRLHNVNLDPHETSQADATWVVKNEGTQVTQTANSDPGLALGFDRFGGLDFNGTLYVDSRYDDDYIGFVFSYQDSSSFYAVVWKKTEQVYWNVKPFRAIGTSGIQLKKVHSSTGPGHKLRNALWHAGDTEGEIDLLWSDEKQIGWESHIRYHWELTHRPELGTIRLVFFKERRLIVDTGYIYDYSFNGGRIGLYAFSQADVVYSSLSYKANDVIPEDYDSMGNDPYKVKRKATTMK